ncbi:hypothetical protein E2C01_010191 [Portunus trituberculatus]|uniref:Uncharacterized protein n=1 Tax=Portunus trituberculatus TaxID=210409 RepID=A0A5B7D7Q1_PORTR|nr:hypothetical protein [Portunus trituberculatus]
MGDTWIETIARAECAGGGQGAGGGGGGDSRVVTPIDAPYITVREAIEGSHTAPSPPSSPFLPLLLGTCRCPHRKLPRLIILRTLQGNSGEWVAVVNGEVVMCCGAV